MYQPVRASPEFIYIYKYIYVVPTITVGVECFRGSTGADTVFFTQAEKLNHGRIFETPISEPLVVS